MILSEILDIYGLHDDPKQLKGHSDAYEKIPELAWKKYKNNEDELERHEDLWATDAELSYLYAGHFKDWRFKKGEPAIIKDPRIAVRYASMIIKGRFKEAESGIAASTPENCYRYALHALKGRFRLGESMIAKDARFSCYYAENILEGRFKLGEPTIKKDRGWTKEYNHILSKFDYKNNYKKPPFKLV